MLRVCDLCQNADAILFCRADSAFLCMQCDSAVHLANKVASRHRRVPILSNGDLSLADSAAFDVVEVHSESMHADPASSSIVTQYMAQNCVADGVEQMQDADLHQLKQNADHHESVDSLHVQDMDFSICIHSSTDSRVPDLFDVRGRGTFQPEFHHVVTDQPYACWQTEQGSKFFDCSKSDGKSADRADLMGWKGETSHLMESFLLSTPGMEANAHDCVVPLVKCSSFSSGNIIPTHEARCRQDILSQLTSTMAINSPPSLYHTYHPRSSIAREARVLKYKEKRKSRNFEKTVRYASRKACAEARPRVNGRFVKGPFQLFERRET